MNKFRSLFDLLDRLGICHETDEHEAVYTAGALAEHRSAQWEFPVKNILLEDKDKQLFLVTMHLNTTALELKELAKMLGAKGRFSFASAERLAQALGVSPGSVTPFAVMNDTGHKVRLVLDERLKAATSLSAHPLVNTMTTTVSNSDFLRLLSYTGHKPEWVQLPLKSAGNSIQE